MIGVVGFRFWCYCKQDVVDVILFDSLEDDACEPLVL